MTDEDELEDCYGSQQEAASMDVDMPELPELPHELREVKLHNAGVEAAHQTGPKEGKQRYRAHVMQKLYDGGWRDQFNFTVAFPLLAVFLQHLVVSKHQKKNEKKSAWKINLWVSACCHAAMHPPLPSPLPHPMLVARIC